MPNLVAYNPGGFVADALQFGTIVMDVNNTVNPGSLIWCPDYGICNQYFIITDSYTNGKTSQINSIAMGFPTTGLTDSALILSINKLAASKSSGPFATLTNAITWAISEGYFIINQEYPSIVTSGCVLNLDASLPASYPLVLNNWYDLSGNGNTGTLNNSVTYSSSSYGNLVFNSSNSDYISFTSPSNIPSGNSNYTISTWFNPSSIGIKGLVGWGDYGSSNQVNAFRLTSTGLVNYWGANDLNVNVSLSTGTWYNAVATFDGTTRQIWLNGSSIASDTPTGHNVTITNNLTVGNTNNIPYEYFDGKIGEVQIFNRALTSTEITQNYNALLPRYNGSYTDPCVTPIYCGTPTPTPTQNVTPTPTPTCPIPTLYLANTSSDACNQINGQLLTNISYTTTGTCSYCNYSTLNSTEIPGLTSGTYYVSDGTSVRAWTKSTTPSVLFNPTLCSSCGFVTPTPTTTQTPTPTPTSSIYTFCLGYSSTDCELACSASCTTYYSYCSTLTVSCSLYTDTSGSIAPDGYYSDGTNCYHLVTPVTPTPTITPTVTPPSLIPVSITAKNLIQPTSDAFTLQYSTVSSTGPWNSLIPGFRSDTICRRYTDPIDGTLQVSGGTTLYLQAVEDNGGPLLPIKFRAQSGTYVPVGPGYTCPDISTEPLECYYGFLINSTQNIEVVVEVVTVGFDEVYVFCP